ncbi:pyridoxal phosphate-dependent aminotransferase [Rhodovibrionaceae bacterium A322]
MTPFSPPLLLNYNENAFGMPSGARKALVAALDEAHRYPDDLFAQLVSELAELNSVDDRQIILGVGSHEVLRAGVGFFNGGPSVQFVEPKPSFEISPYMAALDGKVTSVPVTAELDIDLPGLRRAVEAFDGRSVVYLSNPNNPTGRLLHWPDVKDWISADPDTFFLLDEAYAEYIDNPAFMPGIGLIEDGAKNVVVTRTFSKIYGLAGLRVGYGIAAPETADRLNSLMTIDRPNQPGLVAALAALKDRQWLADSRAANQESLVIVQQGLDELGLAYGPCNANFLLHEVRGDDELYWRRMREQGIWVGRPFEGLSGWNRLTLGKPDEMKQVIAVLKQFRENGWL